MSILGTRTSAEEEKKKNEWDRAQRLPLPNGYYTQAYNRSKKLYNVAEGQYFQNNTTGLVVKIEYVSSSHLVTAVDVRTREVYRCLETDFSAVEMTFDSLTDAWYEQRMLWCRISEQNAKLVRRQYMTHVFTNAFRACAKFLRA